MQKILDGRLVSQAVLATVKEAVQALSVQGKAVKLVVLVVGEDPASAVYVGHKEKACAKVGMLSEKIALPASTSESELIAKIEELNADASVTGMIVQLPLPKHIDYAKVLKAIHPYKDVDGFHAYNMGKMLISQEFEDLAPCTPKGICTLLKFYEIDVAGMDVVVLGRSNIVGKAIASMLLNRDATVTICHSRTKNVSKFTKEADLIVAAVGKPHFLTADMVKPGAIIIDVGIHRLEDGTLAGDVDPAAADLASAFTPVPGGVGPMTVATLLMNTVTAAQKYANL